MTGNFNLHKATKEKNDEFYTQLVDIEKELKHYKEHFNKRIVFCNCDDPFESNFFKYFAMNFNHLQLKKLICTCYDTSPIAYTQLSFIEGQDKTIPNKNRKAYKIEITEVDDYNCDGAVDLADVEYLLKNKKNTLTLLKGDGDFRSQECVELLKECDIVVTNPPFSLFREYVAQLFEYNKKFVIIGNKNAITYKEFFPLLKENKVWLGYGQPSKFLDGNGKITSQVQGLCRWFTNIDISKRHEEVILYLEYSPNMYDNYDNYLAININKVTDIPYDYDGIMGVPITFLDKYNPDQFEIVGLLNSSSEELAGIKCTRKYFDFKEIKQDLTFTGASGNKTNGNPVIKGKPNKGNYYINTKTGETVYSLYARILIRRKK